jgi:hypothetical protein
MGRKEIYVTKARVKRRQEPIHERIGITKGMIVNSQYESLGDRHPDHPYDVVISPATKSNAIQGIQSA